MQGEVDESVNEYWVRQLPELIRVEKRELLKIEKKGRIWRTNFFNDLII
jgi:hypothetical protein